VPRGFRQNLEKSETLVHGVLLSRNKTGGARGNPRDNQNGRYSKGVKKEEEISQSVRLKKGRRKEEKV